MESNAKKPKPFQDKSIWSLLQLGLVFFFIFSAFMSLQGIESSLNFENGLGTLSLSLLYGTNFVSALFIGPPLVQILTPKWSMLLCFIAHTFFIVAHFWSSWQLLMSASFILGVAFSPAWVGNGTFITVLAKRYSAKHNRSFDSTLQLFNSIFYMVFSLNGVPGNIASSLILSTADYSCDEVESSAMLSSSDEFMDSENTTDILTLNFTIGNEFTHLEASTETYIGNVTHAPRKLKSTCGVDNIEVCGPSHCPYLESHTKVLETPSSELVYILLACFLGLNVMGVVLCAFLPTGIKTETKLSCQTILSTFQILRNRDMQLFIVPLFVIFVNDSLFYGSFTQSFVSCAYGIEKVGFAAVSQAAGFLLVTVAFIAFSNSIAERRQMIITITMVVNGALALTWLLWQPTEDGLWVVLLLSGVHGMVHGTYKVQFGAMTSLLFPDKPEAAFSIYNLTFTAATSFTFGISFILCFYIKMYIFIALLVIMCIFYSVLEFKLRKEKSYCVDKFKLKAGTQGGSPSFLAAVLGDAVYNGGAALGIKI